MTGIQVKAKSAITAETTLKFECTLGCPAYFWANLERQYHEDKTWFADKPYPRNDIIAAYRKEQTAG